MPGVRGGVCGEPRVEPQLVNLQRYVRRRRWAVAWTLLAMTGGILLFIIGVGLWRLAPQCAGFRGMQGAAGVQYVQRQALRCMLEGAVLTLIAFGAAAAATVSHRQIRRIRHGWCIKCGYNLTGLPQPRCPECGQPFEPKGDAQ